MEVASYSIETLPQANGSIRNKVRGHLRKWCLDSHLCSLREHGSHLHD